MRAGLFGGTFDPVHHGHCILAQEARVAGGLDEVWMIPAFSAPLRDAPGTTAADRLAMLQRATAELEGVRIETGEIESGERQFTVDTVAMLQNAHPKIVFSWICGADQLAKLPDWRQIEVLAAAVEFLVFEREGFPRATPDIPGLRVRWIPPLRFDCSATAIRERVACGLPYRAWVHPAVADWIAEKGLYREKRKVERVTP